MMKIVKEEYLKHNGGNRNDKLLMIPIGPEKSSIDLSKTAWSKMEFDYYDGPYSRIVYDNFQQMVRVLSKEKDIYPIEYDYLMWDSQDIS